MSFSHQSCQSSSEQLHDFGTKTVYPIPKHLQPLPESLASASSPRLIHVSFIARHGTRNPTDKSINRMTSLEQWLKSALPNSPQWLLDWSTVLAQYRCNPGALTSHGHSDLYSIGVRFAVLYAQSLRRVGATVRIRSSYKERAVSSARAFREGYIAACDQFDIPHRITSLQSAPNARRLPTLDPYSSESSNSELETSPSASSDTDSSDPDTHSKKSSDSSLTSWDHLPVEVLPLGRDAILRYFERNIEYANFANQHKASTHKDLSRGSLRRHTTDMARRMTAAFGSPTPMDIEHVRSVAEAAAFDTAHGRAAVSIFCKTLTATDARMLNKFEKRHRPFFKAHERFRNVSAPLVQDLVNSLTASVETSSGRRRKTAFAADLRFAHAETLVPLLLLLGIRSNGLPSSHPDYRQGLAAMSPFAANLALELYERDKPDGSKSYFVRFRLNERYVERIPALRQHGRNGTVELNHLLHFFDDVLADGK